MSHPQSRRPQARPFAFALAALMILFSLVYTPSPKAKASARQGCMWYQSITYYTDASHSTMCGGTTWFCDGETGHGGCWTQHYTVNYCECSDEPWP